MISTYLIAQIGRDDNFTSNDINLKTFFIYIIGIINNIKNLIGGSTILIEVDNNPKLVDKYKEYGFEYLKDEDSGLTQLWKLTLNY